MPGLIPLVPALGREAYGVERKNSGQWPVRLKR